MCTVGDKRLTNNEGLKYHKETANTAGELHSCTEYEKRFSTQQDLRQHVNRLHKCKCSECGKSFSSSQALAMHNMRVHRRQYKCTDGNDITEHPRSGKPTPYLCKCSECGKSFKNSLALRMHNTVSYTHLTLPTKRIV